MNRNHWAYFCWPGLWSLWHHGAVSGFLLALGSGLCLNLLLLATVVYTETLTVPVRNYSWLALVAFWLASGVGSYGWCRWRHVQKQQANQNDLIAAATIEYLRSNWYQAEVVLWQALKQDRRDVDALLMLATICRRTNRLDEAQHQLDRLDLLERGEKWRLEIARERLLLERKRVAVQTETESDTSASNDSKQPVPGIDQPPLMNESPEQPLQTRVDIARQKAA